MITFSHAMRHTWWQRRKNKEEGWRKMPAHSTMCIWHIGLALTSHNLLRIKNSVYVHNSLSYHTNFPFLLSLTPPKIQLTISFHISPIFLVFRILLVREMRKRKIYFWGVRTKVKKKEEKGKVRKCGNKEYTK